MFDNYLWSAEIWVQSNYSDTTLGLPSFLPLESQKHNLPRNLMKSSALSELHQSFHDIILAALVRWSWYHPLGNIFPELHSRIYSLSRFCECVGTNQWATPSKIHDQKPSIFVVPHYLLSDITNHYLKLEGMYQEHFCYMNKKPRNLSDVRVCGSETS